MSFLRTARLDSSSWLLSSGLHKLSTLSRLLVAVLWCFFLASCGGAAPTAGAASKEDGVQQAIAPLSIPAPPDSGDRPLQAGQSGTAYMPNGLPALQPRGLKPEMLFAEKLKDEDARFQRLENAVVDMRQEFEAVKPAIVRLAAVEEDMQILLQQLESLVNTPSVAQMPPIPVEETALPPEAATLSPQALIPSPNTTTTPQADPKPVVELPVVEEAGGKKPEIAAGPTVQNVRIGEHGDTTRLVLDMKAKASFTHDLDNKEHLLLVEIPDAGWSAAQQGTSSDASLIESWSVQPMENGKGSRLIIRLRRDVVLASAAALAEPDRIMLDLKKQ